MTITRRAVRSAGGEDPAFSLLRRSALEDGLSTMIRLVSSCCAALPWKLCGHRAAAIWLSLPGLNLRSVSMYSTLAA